MTPDLSVHPTLLQPPSAASECGRSTRTLALMKRHQFIIAAMFLAGPCAPALAEEPNLEQLKCPVQPSLQPNDEYRHAHEVLSISSGPLQLEMAEVLLTVVGRDAQFLCFGLITYARNYHMCGFMGVARRTSSNSYLFREGGTELRFTVLDSKRFRVEPIGEGYKDRCGMWGVVWLVIYE